MGLLLAECMDTSFGLCIVVGSLGAMILSLAAEEAWRSQYQELSSLRKYLEAKGLGEWIEDKQGKKSFRTKK